VIVSSCFRDLSAAAARRWRATMLARGEGRHVPEVYTLLVVDRRWQPERYERWLTGILIDQVLRRSA
jgi:hypothetical protein